MDITNEYPVIPPSLGKIVLSWYKINGATTTLGHRVFKNSYIPQFVKKNLITLGMLTQISKYLIYNLRVKTKIGSCICIHHKLMLGVK